MKDVMFPEHFNIEPDVSRIDFREQFDLLNKQYGIDLLYVRSNPNTRCRCYNKLTKDGNSKCKICGGTGFISTIERVKGIYQNFDETGIMKFTEIGLTSDNTVIFYFDVKTVPTVGDRMMLVAFDRSTSIPVPININKSFIIVSVDPIRGESGRIEVYKCYTKYTPERIINEQRRLNAIPVKSRKDIMKGARYTWPNF